MVITTNIREDLELCYEVRRKVITKPKIGISEVISKREKIEISEKWTGEVRGGIKREIACCMKHTDKCYETIIIRTQNEQNLSIICSSV